MMMTEKTTMRKPVRSRGTVREPLMMKKASQTSRARAARETSSSFQTFLVVRRSRRISRRARR